MPLEEQQRRMSKLIVTVVRTVMIPRSQADAAEVAVQQLQAHSQLVRRSRTDSEGHGRNDSGEDDRETTQQGLLVRGVTSRTPHFQRD
jgi:hypothetical protein